MVRVSRRIRQIGRGTLKEQILFLHIPKCGGTSVTSAIGAAYGWRAERRNWISHLDAPASLTGARAAGMGLYEYREQLLLYEMAKPNVRYINGHYPFSDAAMRAYDGDWAVITVLRHPVDRWFSQYFYNHDKDSPHFSIEENLAEHLDSAAGRARGSAYTRRFSGRPGSDAPDGCVERAIQNLDRCAIVGMVEHLDLFREQFRDRFGVSLRIPRLNTNPRSRNGRDREISDHVRRRVEQLCKPDLRVYNQVLESLGR